MNKYLRMFALGLFALLAFFNVAHAAGLSLPIATVPAEVEALMTDVSTVWTTVKGIVIGFAAFGLLMFVVFKVRQKKGS